MCYFLSVGFPSRSRELVSVFEPRRLVAWENTNPSVCAVFPRGETVFWVTDGHCSCRLCPDFQTKFDEGKERARYQKRGWPAAKIERAIVAKRPGLRPEVRQLHDALSDLVNRVEMIHLFGHWYGDQTVETVVAQGQVGVSFSAFLAAEGRYAVDTIVELRPG